MSDRALSYTKRKLEEHIMALRVQATDALLPSDKYAQLQGQVLGLKWAVGVIDQTIKDYRDDRLGDDR